MIRSILAATLIATLTACSSAPPKPVVPDVPVIAEKTTVVIPPGLIAACPPLAVLDESRAYTQGDTLDVLAVWINLYGTCAARFEKYVTLTSKVLNINESPSSNTTDGSK